MIFYTILKRAVLTSFCIQIRLQMLFQMLAEDVFHVKQIDTQLLITELNQPTIIIFIKQTFY